MQYLILIHQAYLSIYLIADVNSSPRFGIYSCNVVCVYSYVRVSQTYTEGGLNITE